MKLCKGLDGIGERADYLAPVRRGEPVFPTVCRLQDNSIPDMHQVKIHSVGATKDKDIVPFELVHAMATAREQITLRIVFGV
jgi:hypothetical protein